MHTRVVWQALTINLELTRSRGIQLLNLSKALPWPEADVELM